MAIHDTDIIDWAITAAGTPPTDGTLIARDLAAQFRNIKSIERLESLDKEFEKTGYLAAATTGGLFTFDAADGDLTTMFVVDRKIRATPQNGGSPVYCGIFNSAFGTSTVLNTTVFSGSLSAAVTYEIDMGVGAPLLDARPLYTQSTSVTISNTSTTGTFTFPHPEPDLDYFCKATIISTTSSVVGATIVYSLSKLTTSVTVGLLNDPGAGTNTVVGITVLRTL